MIDTDLAASTASIKMKNQNQAEMMFGGIIGNIKDKLKGQNDKRLIYIEDGRKNIQTDVVDSLLGSDI